MYTAAIIGRYYRWCNSAGDSEPISPCCIPSYRGIHCGIHVLSGRPWSCARPGGYSPRPRIFASAGICMIIRAPSRAAASRVVIRMRASSATAIVQRASSTAGASQKVESELRVRQDRGVGRRVGALYWRDGHPDVVWEWTGFRFNAMCRDCWPKRAVKAFYP